MRLQCLKILSGTKKQHHKGALKKDKTIWRLNDESDDFWFPASGGGSRRFPRLFVVVDIV